MEYWIGIKKREKGEIIDSDELGRAECRDPMRTSRTEKVWFCVVIRFSLLLFEVSDRLF